MASVGVEKRLRTVTAGGLFLSCLFFALCLFPLRQASSSEPSLPNPHDYFYQSPKCPRCHFYEGRHIVEERFAVESIDFCLECHLVEERGLTHPIRVRPGGKYRGMNVPSEYRLGDGGQIICLTCHKAHGQFLSTTRTFKGQAPEKTVEGSGDTRLYRTYYLRRSDPAREGFEPLCEGCHKLP